MSRNDITGDKIASRPASDEFRVAFDRIFGEVKKLKCVRNCPVMMPYGEAVCGICLQAAGQVDVKQAETRMNAHSGPLVDSDRVCQCSFRGRILGDGCSVCNPELAARYAAENLEGD